MRRRVARASGGSCAAAISPTAGGGAFCAHAGALSAATARANATATARTNLTASPSFLGPVRALRLDAVGVEVELVVVDREAAVLGDLDLALLDVGVVELLDAAALQAHEVVVVAALVQLVDRLAALEMVAYQQARLLELREHAVHRREPHVGVLVEELAVHVLGREVALVAVLEQVQHLEARDRHLEAGTLQFAGIAHGVNYNARFPTASSMRLPASIFALALLSGCGLIYTLDVQQGNYVTKDVAEKLKVGMTKAEVRNLLGTPLLIDAFQPNRLDYYFSNVKGTKAENRTRLSVFFANDKVASFTGEPRPALPPPVGATQPPPPPGCTRCASRWPNP